MALSKKQIANRKKWVENLRSGKFKQGIGKLNANNKFCCQGVACELFKDEVGGKWTRPSGKISGYYNAIEQVKIFSLPDIDGSHFTEDTVWPDNIANLLGISDNDADQLILMNDGSNPVYLPKHTGEKYTLMERATFEEIADAIDLLTFAGL